MMKKASKMRIGKGMTSLAICKLTNRLTMLKCSMKTKELKSKNKN